jgi:uncharacterized membrane protein
MNKFSKFLEVFFGILVMFLPPFFPFLADNLNLFAFIDSQVWSEIKGDLTITLWIVALFFGYLSNSFYWLIKVKKAVDEKKDTPNEFDFVYFITTSWINILISWIGCSLAMLIVLRLPTMFKDYLNESLVDLSTIGFAIIVALAWEKVAENLFSRANNLFKTTDKQ